MFFSVIALVHSLYLAPRGVSRSVGRGCYSLRPRQAAWFSLKFSTPILHEECACGNYSTSACARVSDGVRQFVRRSVGAPTAHACAGNGSHHPEDISPRRGGPPGEFSGALFGTRTRGSRRRAAVEQPLWVDARGSFSCPDLVRREGNARTGAHPAGRIARVLSSGAEQLQSQYRARGDQRDFRVDSAGARSLRGNVPTDSAGHTRSRAQRRLGFAVELFRFLDGETRRLASAFRPLRRLR